MHGTLLLLVVYFDNKKLLNGIRAYLNIVRQAEAVEFPKWEVQHGEHGFLGSGSKV